MKEDLVPEDRPRDCTPQDCAAQTQHYVLIAETGHLGLKLQEPQQPTQEQQQSG